MTKSRITFSCTFIGILIDVYFKYVIFFSRSVLKILMISEELWKGAIILPSYLYDIPGEFLLLPFQK